MTKKQDLHVHLLTKLLGKQFHSQTQDHYITYLKLLSKHTLTEWNKKYLHDTQSQ